jgi:hypothetical protein
VQGGINAEPHGQNLMIELDKKNQPTGVFVHRDFGGFDIDFAFRRKRKLALPAKMTAITTVEKDYKVSSDPARALRKLDSFFWGGLAFNLDKDLPQWGRDGLLKGKGQLAKGDIKRMLEKELVDQYKTLTGKTVRLDGNFRNVSRMLVARKSMGPVNTAAQPLSLNKLHRPAGKTPVAKSPVAKTTNPAKKPAKSTAKPRTLGQRFKASLRRLTKPKRRVRAPRRWR